MQSIMRDIVKSKSMVVVVVFIMGISYISAMPQKSLSVDVDSKLINTELN